MRSYLHLGSVVLCLFATPGFAAIERFRSHVVDNSAGGPELEGYVTNRITIDFTGNLRNSWALIELPPGSIYQDQSPFAGAVPPSAAAIALFPSLAFDTFVAVGSLTSTTGFPPDILIRGICPPDIGIPCLPGEPPPVFDDSVIDVVWSPRAGIVDADQTDFLIMQLTLRNDVQGTARFLSTTEGAILPWPTAEFRIVDGVLFLIPEPSSLALVGLALLTLTGLTRRRVPARRSSPAAL